MDWWTDCQKRLCQVKERNYEFHGRRSFMKLQKYFYEFRSIHWPHLLHTYYGSWNSHGLKLMLEGKTSIALGIGILKLARRIKHFEGRIRYRDSLGPGKGTLWQSDDSQLNCDWSDSVQHESISELRNTTGFLVKSLKWEISKSRVSHRMNSKPFTMFF